MGTQYTKYNPNQKKWYDYIPFVNDIKRIDAARGTDGYGWRNVGKTATSFIPGIGMFSSFAPDDAYYNDVNKAQLNSIKNDLQQRGINVNDINNLDYIIDQYYENAGGNKYNLNFDRLVNDLLTTQDFISSTAMPKAPDYQGLWDTAQSESNAEIDKLLAALGADEARRTSEYNAALNDLRTQYNDARSTLLSKDYQDRARMFDTISSDLSKTRRNALEAGASAGLRIAGNINTMLSAQNKQAQQSMETSNNLAQMLLNQRNAQNALRSNYSNYMSNSVRERNSLESSRYDRAANRYNTSSGIASGIYNQQKSDYDAAYAAVAGADNTAAKVMQGQQYANAYKNRYPSTKTSQ